MCTINNSNIFDVLSFVFSCVASAIIGVWTVIEFFLKKKISEKLEFLKKDLKQINLAFETDYKFYKTERLKAIIELHRKLTDFFNSAYKYVLLISAKSDINQFIADQDYDRRRLEYQKSLVSLLNSNDYSYIFIENKLYERIQRLFNLISNSCTTYHDIYLSALKLNDSNGEELFEKLTRICDNFELYDNEYRAIIDTFKDLIEPNYKNFNSSSKSSTNGTDLRE